MVLLVVVVLVPLVLLVILPEVLVVLVVLVGLVVLVVLGLKRCFAEDCVSLGIAGLDLGSWSGGEGRRCWDLGHL